MEILTWPFADMDGDLKRLGACLRSGGIVVYPTDTLYGLGVDAMNPDALRRLRQLKGRDRDPFSVLVSDKDTLMDALVPEDRGSCRAFLPFLPGALTLVGRTSLQFPPELADGGKRIGFRLPDHEVCKLLSREAGVLLTSTSVNPAGESPARSIPEILSYFPEGIDLLIDAGTLEVSLGSTVIDISTPGRKILREGAIPARVLQIGAA